MTTRSKTLTYLALAGLHLAVSVGLDEATAAFAVALCYVRLAIDRDA